MTLHRTTVAGLMNALDRLSHLPASERLALTTIASRRGHPVSVKELAHEVYGRMRKNGGALDAEGGVQILVYRLRKKGFAITARYGWGYALVTGEAAKAGKAA